MEVLRLEPPDCGVHTAGIYVIDEDGTHVYAGPSVSETAALAWIDQRQETLIRNRLAHTLAAN